MPKIELTAEQREALGDRLRNPLAIIHSSMELALMHPGEDENVYRNRAALLAAKRLSEALKEWLGI
jgi:hypothetical protein